MASRTQPNHQDQHTKTVGIWVKLEGRHVSAKSHPECLPASTSLRNQTRTHPAGLWPMVGRKATDRVNVRLKGEKPQPWNCILPHAARLWIEMSLRSSAKIKHGTWKVMNLDSGGVIVSTRVPKGRCIDVRMSLNELYPDDPRAPLETGYSVWEMWVWGIFFRLSVRDFKCWKENIHVTGDASSFSFLLPGGASRAASKFDREMTHQDAIKNVPYILEFWTFKPVEPLNILQYYNVIRILSYVISLFEIISLKSLLFEHGLGHWSHLWLHIDPLIVDPQQIWKVPTYAIKWKVVTILLDKFVKNTSRKWGDCF